MAATQEIRNPQLVEIARDFESASGRLHRLRERVGAGDWFRRADPQKWSPGECVVHLNLTSEAYLPLMREALATAPPLEPERRMRRDLMGWFLWRIMPPPVRFMRVKTLPRFVPQAADPDRMLADFARLQSEQLACVTAADGRALDRVFVTSPFNPRARYNLFSCLGILPRHQHRHLWQAEQTLAHSA